RLSELFPRHRGAFVAFIGDVLRTEDELERWPLTVRGIARHGFPRRLWRYRNATLQDVFDHHRLPLEAQALLALQWPDFLLPPAELSFFAWVMLFTGYMRGAYYPTRHYESIVAALVGVIEKNGGEVLVNQKVVAFLL